MNFLKALFGSSEQNPEEEKKSNEAKQFDMLKFDGVKAMRIGKLDAAERFFLEALKLHEDYEIRDYLSKTYIHLDRLDDSLKQMEIIASAHPDNVEVLKQMAHVAYMQENYESMKDYCERAEAIDGQNSHVHFLYAQALIGMDDRIGGVARLTKAVALDENNGDARLLRGQTLYRMGDIASAVEDVRWLMEHVQPQEDVFLLGARVMHVGKNDEVALKLYDAVTQINPFCTDAYRERGKIRFDKGDKQGAEEDMKKVLELNPEELSDISGDYKAEGVEEQVKRAYSMMNPFGI